MNDAAAPSILALFGAVRRHLWAEHLWSALRAATWAACAAALALTSAHLLLRPMPASALVVLPLAAIAFALTYAAWRRPDDSRCAWWADRRLGGASAYSTWLDLRSRPNPDADVGARVRVEGWAAKRVAASRVALAGMPSPTGMARPLLAAAASAAIAMPALLLVEPSPGSGREAAGDLAAATDRPEASTTAAQAFPARPAASGLGEELAQALRPAQAAETGGSLPVTAATDRGARADPTTEAESDRRPAVAAPGSTRSPRAGGAAEARAARSTPADPGRGADRPARAAADRDVGDRVDARRDPGTSAAVRASAAAARATPAAHPPGRAQEMKTVLDEAASGDGPESAQAGARTRTTGPAPPATPPAADDAPAMTPTEATYARAWMQAIRPGR